MTTILGKGYHQTDLRRPRAGENRVRKRTEALFITRFFRVRIPPELAKDRSRIRVVNISPGKLKSINKRTIFNILGIYYANRTGATGGLAGATMDLAGKAN